MILARMVVNAFTKVMNIIFHVCEFYSLILFQIKLILAVLVSCVHTVVVDNVKLFLFAFFLIIATTSKSCILRYTVLLI